MLLKAFAATAVLILGLVASLNFVDQKTVTRITSHPVYRAVHDGLSGVTESDASPDLAPTAPPPRTSSAPIAAAQTQSKPKASAQARTQAKAKASEPIQLSKVWAKVERTLFRLKDRAVALVKGKEFNEFAGEVKRVTRKAVAKSKVYGAKAKRFAIKQYRKLTKTKKTKTAQKRSKPLNESTSVSPESSS